MADSSSHSHSPIEPQYVSLDAYVDQMELSDVVNQMPAVQTSKNINEEMLYKTAVVDAANVAKIGSGEGDNPTPPPANENEVVDDEDSYSDDSSDEELNWGLYRLATIPEVENENDNSAPAENEPASAPGNENEMKEKYTIYYSDTEDESNKKKKKQKGRDVSDSDNWDDIF